MLAISFGSIQAAFRTRSFEHDRYGGISMNPLDIASANVIALSVAALTFACGVLGMITGGLVPERIMSPSAQDGIRLITGFMATLAALVFGLLINSANNLANSQEAGLESMTARALQLHQALALYGPEAKPGQDLLKHALIEARDRYWGKGVADPAALQVSQSPAYLRSITEFLATLQPTTEFQQRMLAQSFAQVASLGESRVLMSLQVASTISSPFGAILVAWVSLLFFGFGVIGRLNRVVAVGLAVGACAIGSAVFLILELGQPYTGVARLSPAPLLQVIESMDR
ncbi:MAG TPA: hypothetical protein VKI44_10580 [Acetobacteraceae bacterium]|nr:hypothetical protein [Acetobacteraceae bacterium]